MRRDPILIAAPARSGTTMLAWLLHLHGVWIGNARPTDDPSTNPQVGTENDDIIAYLRNPADWPDGLERIVPPDTRWLLKTGMLLPERHRFYDAFPEATWLLPRRPLEDIMASRDRTNRRSGARTGDRVRQHLALQAKIPVEASRALVIDPARLCKGGQEGEEEARRAVEYCGLTFYPENYHGWVQPERWHF